MANILVVGPHPDDQELGMGGTIALLAAQGHRVLLLDMTDGEPTPHGSPEIRAKEAAEAAQALSFPGNLVQRVLLGLRNRFVEHSVEARHKVAGIIRSHQAQIVFVPHPEDARFDAKLTKIEMPVPEGMTLGPPIYPKWLFHYYATHLRIVPHPSFLMDISAHLDQKLASIAAYRSQFDTNPKNRQVPEWVKAQGVYMGSRIGAAAAEPFFAVEPLGLNSLQSLAV